MSDPDAERGTRIHSAWQTGNIDALAEDENEDYTTGIRHMDDVIAAWGRDNGLNMLQELPRETRLWLNDEATQQPIFSGQMDRWYRSGTHLLIIDGKSGWGTYVPPSQRAWQLRGYAVLAWSEYRDVTKIRVAFVKPKIHAEPTDWTDYELIDLQNSLAAILFQLWYFNQPEAPIVPGPQCRWCKAKPHCAQAASWSMLPSVIARAASPSPQDIEAAVNALVPADLVKVWQTSTVIQKIQEAVKARLKSFSDEDLTALGIERGKAKITRSIDAVEAAFRYMKDTVNVPESALFDALKFSNSELAKVLRREVGMSAEGAPAWIRETLKQWVTESESEAPLQLLKS